MAVELFADLTNARLVASAKGGSAKPIASPFHQDKLYLSIQPLDYASSGAPSSPFSLLDAAAFAITVLVTKTDGTTLAGPTVISTPSGTASVGSVDLNTVAMATAFTSSSTLSVDAYVFIQFNDSVNRKTTIQTDLTIKRSYITSGTPSELPITSYVTFADLAPYVKFSGNPNGSTITLPSDSGTYKAVVGANDDGSGGASVET